MKSLPCGLVMCDELIKEVNTAAKQVDPNNSQSEDALFKSFTAKDGTLLTTMHLRLLLLYSVL